MKKYYLLLIYSILTLAQIYYTPDQNFVQQSLKTNNLQNYKDIANCICDITFNVCNFLCCCDNDCVQATRDEWKEMGSCLLESEETPKILDFPRCSRWQQNPRDKYLFMSRINHITCIVYESVPYQGYFYLELTNSSVYKYNQDILYPSNYYQELDLTSLVGKGYTPLTPIFVKIDQGSGKTLSYFTLSSADIFNQCNGAQQIIFQQDFSSQCLRQIILNSDYCSDYSFISSLRYKTIGFLSNSQLDLEAAKINLINEKSILFSIDAVDTTQCICSNALNSLTFIITIENNIINQVNITFGYQDIKATCDSKQIIKQSQAVNFVIANEITTSQIPRSGAPGYFFDKQLIIGVQGNKTIDGADRKLIYRPKKGFSINIADSKGKCILTSNIAQLAIDDNRQIKFGADFDTSCNMEMTYTQFQTNCKNANYYQDYYVYNLFKEDEVFVGKFGNADYHKLMDWVPVKLANYYKVLATDTKYDIKCANIPNSVVITIFYSEAGAIGNDQRYILEVQKNYPTNTVWRWQKATSDSTDVQQFTVQLKVIFVNVKYYEIQQELVGPPDKIKEVINYLFQPFISNENCQIQFNIIVLFFALLLIQLI